MLKKLQRIKLYIFYELCTSMTSEKTARRCFRHFNELDWSCLELADGSLIFIMHFKLQLQIFIYIFKIYKLT